jgi:hypothetical protein
MTSEKIIAIIDREKYGLNIEEYVPEKFNEYADKSLSNDIFILPKKEGTELFNGNQDIKYLLYNNQNIIIEDNHYKIKELDKSDTLYVLNRNEKNLINTCTDLTKDALYRMGVDYENKKYIVDTNNFLDDVLLENKQIRTDLNCYPLTNLIKDDASIYFYNQNTLIIYSGIYINLYQLIINMLSSNMPSKYEKPQNNRKINMNFISRILYERFREDE